MVARGVVEDRRCRDRLEAMVARVEAGSVEVLDDEAVEAALLQIGPRQSLPRGGLDARSRDKDLVAFARLGPERADVFPGYSWRELRNARFQRIHHGVTCQTGVEIQSAVGCAFDCSYCPYSSFVCVRLDVETFISRVARLVTERRFQVLYKLNNRTDTLALEPEYGLAAALIELFAGLDQDRRLVLNSKSGEVEHLLGLEHRGRTVASFTLTPGPVAELLEPGATPPAARIVALGRLAGAGYPVRVRFSPIVPLIGWREAYRDLIAQLVAVTRPEMVTLWTLSMISFEELHRIVPPERLDPVALAAARTASLRGQKGAPFPTELRVELYRELAGLVRQASPETVVSLCLETPEVWDALAGVVTPRRRGRFLCNCGPRALMGTCRV